MSSVIHVHDRHTKIRPRQQAHYLGAAMRPLRFDIVAPVMEAERLIGGAGAVDAIKAEVRCARSLRAPAAYKKLAKIGPTGIRCPDLAGALLPTGDDPSSADRRPGSRRGFPKGVGILRCEH